MKKYLLILIIPFVYLFAKDMKIGFVSSTRIFSEYQATAAANVKFNEFVDVYRDSAAILRKNIEDLKADLESQKLVLSEEARLRKLDEIESTTDTYDQFLQNVFGKGGKIEQKNDELMAPLLKKINDAVAKIAGQEDFSAILDFSDGVFYASSESDLTNLVIDELNLEYGPAVAPGETKKFIAIFPFREKNSEAVDAGLGQRCQNELYNAVASLTQQFEIISKTQINSEIIKRGLGINIEDNQALNIGLMLLCDYIIIGNVSKFTNRIEYIIFLKDVKNNKEIAKKSSTVTEDIKLYETLKNDLFGLIEKIP